MNPQLCIRGQYSKPCNQNPFQYPLKSYFLLQLYDCRSSHSSQCRSGAPASVCRSLQKLTFQTISLQDDLKCCFSSSPMIQLVAKTSFFFLPQSCPLHTFLRPSPFISYCTDSVGLASVYVCICIYIYIVAFCCSSM